MLTFKYRLYPSHSQQAILWKHSKQLNYLYNYFIDDRIKKRDNNIKVSKLTQQKELVNIKKSNPIIKEINSQVIQQVTDRLDKSFQAFFKRGYGFPKFRSNREFFTITYPQGGARYINNVFFTTKQYGKIKFKKHIDIKGDIKTISIVLERTKWFLCITTDDNIEKKERQKEIVGVDVGEINIAATSDGELIKNTKETRYYNKIIDRIKSRRDKCKKWSRRQKRLNKTVKRLYGVKNNKKKDFLHKVSRHLSNNYDAIVLEKLDIKKMSESEIVGKNRELRNACMGQFQSYLSYKANNIIWVNPAYTSKRCYNCGHIHMKMMVKDREMMCHCGYREDRDVNAAKNILLLGTSHIESFRLNEMEEVDVNYIDIVEKINIKRSLSPFGGDSSLGVGGK